MRIGTGSNSKSQRRETYSQPDREALSFGLGQLKFSLGRGKQGLFSCSTSLDLKSPM